MPDLTKLFENAFGKHELIKSGKIASIDEAVNTPTKIMKESTEALDAHNASLHPERIGRKKREAELKAKQEYEDFVKSITEDEYNNLLLLSRDRWILSKSQLIAIGEAGEDLGTERLENMNCIKREKVPDDDLFQFSITGYGRKILRDLNQRLGK
jgi:hypothetical protein